MNKFGVGKTEWKEAARSALTFSAFLVVALSTPAYTDQRVDLPDGWGPDREVAASAPAGVALVLYSAARPSEARVMQIAGERVADTLLSGKVRSLNYSPDSRYLLAHRFVPDPKRKGAVRTMVTLLDPAGGEVWSKDDAREFTFSTTGEVVSAWPPAGGGGKSDPSASIYGLDGRLIRTVEVDASLRSFLALGDGRRGVLVMGQTVMCMELAGDVGTVWKADLAHGGARILALRSLGDNLLVLNLSHGGFKIVRSDGTLLYEYDPAALAGRSGLLAAETLSGHPVGEEIHGGRSDREEAARKYSGYRAQFSRGGATVLLSDGTADGLVLDLVEAKMRRIVLDVAPPPGFDVKPWWGGDRIVFFAVNEVRIRQIPSPAAEPNTAP